MVDISALNSDGGENHHPDYSVARVDLKDHPEKGRALPYIFWELKRSNEDDKFEEDKFTCNKKKSCSYYYLSLRENIKPNVRPVWYN